MHRHDPLCPKRRWHRSFYATCQCNLISLASERVAEALPTAFALRMIGDDGEMFILVDDAVRIARNRGLDD